MISGKTWYPADSTKERGAGVKRTLTEKQKKTLSLAAVVRFILLSLALAWFVGRPLIRFARQELSQPVGKLRVENAYKLTHAAYNAPKFADDRQKGLIAREYAGVLYYCGRPDKALEVAKVSMQLLKNSPNPKEYETAKDLVVYYNTVLRMSKAIR